MSMKSNGPARYLCFAFLLMAAFASGAFAQNRVKTSDGEVEGRADAAGVVRTFKGIPFAEPPVGDLRWKAPQPVKGWKGARKADQFGPRCMQRAIFSDMVFRSNGVSEDCLYLNVWTPAKRNNERLPVLVYFFGGGFMAGDGSEPRYDGESMARRGIVAVTVNYRLGVFGFLAHPELTKESPHRASGNYGLLDQHAALKWVQRNIAAFGGDPRRVTIAGESAGSIAVSAQMASPLSKNLIAGAIGESGSILGALSAAPLANAEENGAKFASTIGAESLAALRAMPADKLLEATARPGLPRLSPTIDGYFFPKDPVAIFSAGEQARVPLLVGSNTLEAGHQGVLGREAPTVENYRAALKRLYNDRADDIFKLYPASNETEVIDAAQDLASDRFIAYSTWKWIDAATKTGGKATYYYLYARPRPATVPDAQGNVRPPARGAAHSAEIEYAMGNLDSNKVYAWAPEDYKVAQVMQEFFVNFIKTGDPNGKGAPVWPKYSEKMRMIIDVNTRSEPDAMRARYEYLDQINQRR
ncbi:MAG: carboxylesterase family protein [Blastocatellales bacterium]|nr:carboxylesterase family protein [Blastocatellales bacterium]